MQIRKKIRLKDYNYSKQGVYFITICVDKRLNLLGRINNKNYIELSKEGRIVEKYIKTIEEIYTNIIIDEYVIMPNHIHLLIIINSENNITISRIIKQYKMKVSKGIDRLIWQKSFYEHVVRNEKEYLKIKEYIQNNVVNWKKDIYF